MGTNYSTYFCIDHKELLIRGAFDGCIDADCKLHVDPLLLKQCTVPEFADAYEAFFDFFNRFVAFVPLVKEPKNSDFYFSKMVEFFTLSEIPNTGLGYSEKGNHGRGISGALSIQLANTAYNIIKAGITNPKFFGWLQLIEKNIGADRISDMTLAILQPYFLKYTERIASECKIKVCKYEDISGTAYMVPFYNKKPVHFIPMQLLTDLPVAHSFEEVGDVCEYNDKLKRKIANIIGITWAEYSKFSKDQWKDILVNNKACTNEAINLYEKLTGKGYDFKSDDHNIYYAVRIQEFLKDYPISFLSFKRKNPAEEIYELTKGICGQFKYLVEDRRMSEMFYRNGRQPDETDWQLLLLTIADTYQKAGGFDAHVSREGNPGVGEIDFQITRGAKANTCVEIKRSINKDLYHGYRQQLPAYMNAENADTGIFIVILEDDSREKIESKLAKIQADMKEKDEYIPEVIYVDGRKQPSASDPKYVAPSNNKSSEI